MEENLGPRPSVQAISQGQGQDPRPSTAQEVRPSIAQDPRPSTAQDPRPSTAQDPRASTAQDPRASTAQDPRASTFQDPRASTAQDPRASIAQDVRPSTSQDPRPSQLPKDGAESTRPSSLNSVVANAKKDSTPSVPSPTQNVRRKIKRVKPWEERKHVGNTIRAKLPGLESYDRELEYHVEASPKITLRMERVIGTDRIRINDSRWMDSMSRKIDDEEKKIWKQRDKKRYHDEQERYRQMVIDGIVEPTPDMVDLESHPIFRVNRMMRRISNIFYGSPDERVPPPIRFLEPFEDQKRTGYLFGWHKNHYLRVNRSRMPSQLVVKSLGESIEDDAQSPEQTRAGSVLHPMTAIDQSEDEEEEEEGEDEDDQLVLPESEVSRTDDLAEYLRRESMSQARRYLKIDDAQVATFDIQPKDVVKVVFDESKDTSAELFDYSESLLSAYQREQVKTDEFCSKVHRRLFV